MLNDILDASMISKGVLRLNVQAVDVGALIDDVMSLIESLAQGKNNIKVIKDLRAIPKTIRTDPDRLKQVLINLLGNALKFTIKGHVKLSVRADLLEPELLFFLVEDTGVGIKQEDLCKLFRTYGKLEATQHLNARGIGLGLVFSQTIVKLLGGGITVQSQENIGTTFAFQVKRNLEAPYCGGGGGASARLSSVDSGPRIFRRENSYESSAPDIPNEEPTVIFNSTKEVNASRFCHNSKAFMKLTRSMHYS
jgi:signal transduction histidine kinase